LAVLQAERLEDFSQGRQGLARTPMNLIEVVMKFVENNQMVQTVADFLQRTLSTPGRMAPTLGLIATPRTE
jgi:hypothetical protein